MQRVTRPRGGVNEWLYWLPITLHKKLDYLFRLIRIYSRRRGEKLVPLPSENGSGSVGLASVLEADIKQIVTMAHQTYEKYFLFQHLAIENSKFFYLSSLDIVYCLMRYLSAFSYF